MSITRKRYFLRLYTRIVILLLSITVCLFFPQWLQVLEGNDFFRTASPLHLLWAIWVVDMFFQILPVKNKVALGSQKLFASRFRPIREKINAQALRNYVHTTTRSAYKVMVLWGLLAAVIGALYYLHIIDKTWLLLLSVFFYVCDLICVLVWCPFRLIMKNKCCTTCRIFNWDHMMMFTPMIFMGGFFALSLVAMAVTAWLIWELCVLFYPERFWEMTNLALKCSECTDKLCTQYCQKLR